jgi:hypothetical protein
MKKKVDASFVGQSIESLLSNGPDQTKRMSELNFPDDLQGKERATHREGRVLSFLSSRRNLDPPGPQPLIRRRVCPFTLWFRGEGHTRWRERGRESFNSNKGTYTVVLYIYVLCGAIPHRRQTQDKDCSSEKEHQTINNWLCLCI